MQCFDGEGNALTDETDIVVVNPIRYRGYYYDAETGLYYISSRYYDPSVKRMLNSDDESLSAASLEALTDKNYFAYCDNNPVGREDVGGEFWHIVAGAAVGGVLNSIDTTSDLVSAYRNGGDVKKAWLHLGVSFTTGAVSGGLATSGAGPIASMITDAVCSTISSVGEQFIYTKKITIKQVAIDVGKDTASNLIASGISTAITRPIEKYGKKVIKKSTRKLSQYQTSKQKRTHAVAIKNAKKKQTHGAQIVSKSKTANTYLSMLFSGLSSGIQRGLNFIRQLLRW